MMSLKPQTDSSEHTFSLCAAQDLFYLFRKIDPLFKMSKILSETPRNKIYHLGGNSESSAR
jgi:hypothetical protein